MHRINLLLILRNLKRNKGSFFINLIGLSIGFTCTVLIYLWVNDERSMDRFNKNDKQLYQVLKNNTTSDQVSTGEDTPALLGRTLKQEFPEVEKAVTVFPPADFTFKGIASFGENRLKGKCKFTDSEFFTVFTYPIILGKAEEVFASKSAVAISRSLAVSLFSGVDNAIGKTIEWKGDMANGPFQVAAIFEDTPVHSTIQFDLIFNYDFLLEKAPNMAQWSNSGPSTFLILKEHTDLSNFNRKIKDLVKTKFSESTLTLFARPYTDRYLFNNYKNGVQAGGRIAYVRLFSIIAVFILIIACINFMNLSTAKAFKRINEIGIKKTVGISRSTLIMQYMGETLLTTFLSLLVAILIIILFLPQFNTITGKHIELHTHLHFILSLAALAIVTGIVAGIYPAFYLSKFRPTELRKGKSLFSKTNNKKEFGLRTGLVVFQFMSSVVLIILALGVSRQIDFIQTKNLGFNRNNVIDIPVEGKLAENPEAFLTEIKKIPGIVNASFSDGDLERMHNGTSWLEWDGKAPDQVVNFESLAVGYNFTETMGIKLEQGRSFSKEFGAETSKIIFNEKAIEEMGFTNPIGQTIKLWGNDMQIIGVTQNFHFESLYENIKPFFFKLSPRMINHVFVKIENGQEKKTLAKLSSFYEDFNLGLPFEYQFMDDNFRQLYIAEQRIGILSKYFAALAIFISCLGLSGLATYSSEQRTKEIGIRKVNGAKISEVMAMLNKDFVKWVAVAFLIAAPLAWYSLSRWLENFAYKTELSWWIFALAGLLALGIALLTVSWQSWKAATRNPVEALRYE